MALSGTVDVVRIMPRAGEETVILLPTHRRADSGCGHRDYLPRKCMHTRQLSGGRLVVVLHRLRTGSDRLDDILVAGAPAEIAFQLASDGPIVEVVTFAVHHIESGHDHASVQ